MTTELFIIKSKKKHNNKFDYSYVEYIDYKTKVKINCPIHGMFEQTPASHIIAKFGCPKCRRSNQALKQSFSKEDFLKKSIEIHFFKYSYNKVVFKDLQSKVIITCPIHGDFEQKASYHINGNGCTLCGINKRSNVHQSNIDDVLISFKKVHNDKYNYDKVNYTKSKNKVIITCSTHGDFEQRPNDHINGYGCPSCGGLNSNNHNEIIDFLNINNIKIEKNNRSLLNGKEIDIYLPDYNIGIEYNGIYWHSEKFVDKNYHLNKSKICDDINVQLIHIFEDEWNLKKEIIKSRILNLIKLTPSKIYARQCFIKEVSSKESKIFLDNNHLQGNVNAKIKLGLFMGNELVGLMTFSSLRKNLGSVSQFGDYELLRFCNKINTNVIGGASRLMKYFIKIYNPNKIISYADKKWSNGNLYEKLGFNFIHDSTPNYYYVIGNKRKNRFEYRKDILIKQGFDPNKSEHQIMLDRKIYRIYDCGAKKYILILKK